MVGLWLGRNLVQLLRDGCGHDAGVESGGVEQEERRQGFGALVRLQHVPQLVALQTVLRAPGPEAPEPFSEHLVGLLA